MAHKIAIQFGYIYNDEKYYCMVNHSERRVAWYKRQDGFKRDVTDDIVPWIKKMNLPRVQDWTSTEYALFKLKFH